MDRIAIAALGALMAVAAVDAQAPAADEPPSLGQPGFYGVLELGDDSPRPEVHFSEPLLINPVADFEDSIYLRVRPGESTEWALRCQHYEACGRYVYFVNDDWYEQVYVPYYRERRDRDDPTYDEGKTESVNSAPHALLHLRHAASRATQAARRAVVHDLSGLARGRGRPQRHRQVDPVRGAAG